MVDGEHGEPDEAAPVDEHSDGNVQTVEPEQGPIADVSISILTFNPRQRHPPYLTSPRSLEACKLVGVEPEELLELPLEHFTATYPDDDLEVTTMRCDHAESMRRRYVERVKEEREDLIRAEERSSHARVLDRPVEEARKEFQQSIAAQQKAYVEKLHKTQKKVLQQLMLYEIRVSALQERKRIEQEEAEAKEGDIRRRREMEKRRVEELRLQEEMQVREREMQVEKLERREAARHFEEYRQQVLAREAERVRQRKLHDQQQVEASKAYVEQRRQLEEMAERKRRACQEKEKDLLRADIERQRRLAERRYIEQLEIQERKQVWLSRTERVMDTKDEVVERKVSSTARRMHDAAERAEEHHRALAEQRAKRRALERTHEQHVRERFYHRQGGSHQEVVDKMARKEQLFKEQQEKLLRLINLRKARNRIREESIKQYFEKRQRAQEFRRKKLMDRVELQEERHKVRQEMTQMLVTQRLLANRMCLKRKDDILQHFEKLMVGGKLSEDELQRAVEGLLEEEEDEPPLAQEEPVQEDPAPPIEDSCGPGDLAPPEVVEIQRNLPRKPSTAPPSSSASYAPLLSGPSDAKARLTSRYPGEGKLPRSRRPASPPHVTSKSSGRKLPPELAIEMLEGLRRQQNEELKQVLLDEQQAEARRETLLAATTDPSERLRLETVTFAQERAAASDKIIRVTQAHEDQLEKRRFELQERTSGLPPLSAKLSRRGY